MSASPARVLMNDFRAQWAETSDDVLAAVAAVGESGWYVLGAQVAEFERKLGEALGSAQVVGCASGLDALEIALRAAGLKPGERVITTPLSAFATTLAIVRAGGVPVFVDTDASGLLDLAQVEAVLRADRGVRFAVPVHLYGHALDLRTLARLQRDYALCVIEDAAQAIGARSHGLAVGSVGQLAATSFYPTKNLGALGDGGALFTRDPALAAAARCLRDYGQSAKYQHDQLGMNSRLDEVQAAILARAMLPRWPRWNARRGEIAARYLRGLKHPQVQPLPVPEGCESVWHLFPVLVQGGEPARARLIAHLDAAGIGSGVHYPRLIPEQKALEGTAFATHGSLERARTLCHGELSLPIHPQLTDAQVDQVVATVNAWPAT